MLSVGVITGDILPYLSDKTIPTEYSLFDLTEERVYWGLKFVWSPLVILNWSGVNPVTSLFCQKFPYITLLPLTSWVFAFTGIISLILNNSDDGKVCIGFVELYAYLKP